MASTSRASATSVSQRKTELDGKADEPTLVESLLCHWDHLPEWQRDNHYIYTGYVRETNSFRKTLHSLTYLHNETVNIYSHLIPSAAVLTYLVATILTAGLALVETIPYVSVFPDTDWSDYVAASIFGAGVATCLGLSAAFHTLKSHSHTIATFGNKLDYLGIVVLIVTSMVSLTHYAFNDRHGLRALFWTITGVLGAACATVSLSSKFRTPDWRPVRAAMFVAFGLSGALPVLWCLYTDGTDETWNRFGLGWLLAEAALYIGGAGIYAARIPERFTPGKYDYFGHSHQIFHVMVVLAAICHGICLHQSYVHAHTQLRLLNA